MITFLAVLKRKVEDEDGEGFITFRVPESEQAKTVGLTALHKTVLRVLVTVAAEDDQPPLDPVLDTPTPAQYAKLALLVRQLGWTEAEWRPKLKVLCGVEHRSALTAGQMSQWLSELERSVVEEGGRP